MGRNQEMAFKIMSKYLPSDCFYKCPTLDGYEDLEIKKNLRNNSKYLLIAI